MKNFLIQSCSSKLFKNISNLRLDDCNILNLGINNNLYKIYYTHKLTHALFKAELLTAEIIQFIQEFGGSEVKCFVHHETASNRAISDMSNLRVVHLGNNDHPETITIPYNLINSDMFFDKNLSRSDSIVCFCEYAVLPEFLNDYLYPKTQLPIKLFNNSKISHHQNLGLISEKDRATILQTNKYYLALGEKDPYILEAKMCGSIVLQLNQLDSYSDVIYTAPDSYMEYKNFVKDNLL